MADESLRDAASRNDFAQSLLLAKRRESVAKALQDARQRQLESGELEPTDKDDDDDDDHSSGDSRGGDDDDDENGNEYNADGTRRRGGIRTAAEDLLRRDNFELRARLVQMERHLRELDLRIISAINSNDFASATELHRAKKVQIDCSAAGDVAAGSVVGGRAGRG
jgi:hypothetical protein